MKDENKTKEMNQQKDDIINDGIMNDLKKSTTNEQTFNLDHAMDDVTLKITSS